jgi:hypothetical protein
VLNETHVNRRRSLVDAGTEFPKLTTPSTTRKKQGSDRASDSG